MKMKEELLLIILMYLSVTLLSVISAHKMIPRRIKLSFEDQIRYQSIHKAWCLYQEKKRNLRNFNLKKQYVSAQEACDDLESLSLNEGIDEKGGFAFLYHSATVTERGKRFPLDMKIPTETPPTRIWNDSWKPQTEEGQDPKSGVREIETNKETVKETATD